jgi:hypothetical protein
MKISPPAYRRGASRPRNGRSGTTEATYGDDLIEGVVGKLHVLCVHLQQRLDLNETLWATRWRALASISAEISIPVTFRYWDNAQ